MKKKFIKMFALATILGCGLGVVTSCGSNIDSTPSTEEVDDINLTLSEENLSININQTKTLTANTNNNNLYLFTWSSSDKEIATVSKGTITALKPGSVDITVSVKKKGSAKVLATKTCKVVVVNKSLTLDKTEMTISMSEGKTGVITATITDDAPITWTSSDETIATVDGGVVTAIKAGSVTITAKSGDLEATCAVNIYKNFFSLNATEIIEVGESKKLEVNGELSADAKYSTSDETVAIVNGGVVTALKEGTTKITAICGSESAECDVTVVNSEANKLQISNEVLELNVSTNKTYTLTATKPGVDNLEVVWHSSDETVATVDGGVVTALKKGVCDITATYNGETVTCKLTVIDDNVIDLKSGNKQAAIDNAGNWNYLADGKSSVSATPTYNQKDNEINIDVSKVATANKKYVYLRYQPTESGEYKVTLTINYVGEGVANIEISGGSATAVTSDLENGENKIEFTFTVDSKNPFQIKFKSEGNFVITPVFEKIIK